MNLKHKNLIFLGILFATAILAFGLRITRLGFYLDDWIIVQAFNQGGIKGIITYAVGDSRPFVAWVWIVGYYLFGSQPLGWQIYSLFFRILTVFIFWLILCKFFPEHFLRPTMIALIFFVYPIFLQQPTSIAFSHHWIAFTFFLLSIYFQILALDRKRYLNIWLVLALLCDGIQLFTNEYFIALELARPIVIGLYLCRGRKLQKSDWGKIFWACLPFFILLGIFLLWRFVFINLPVEDRNTPTMIVAFFKAPVYAMRVWLEMFFKSMIESLLGVWYHALDPNTVVFKPFSRSISWLLTLFAALVLIPLFLFINRREQSHTATDSDRWALYALPLGIFLMVLGFLPGWGIGRTLSDSSGAYNDRFGLAAALGASLVLISSIELLVKHHKAKLVLCAVLVGIGIGYQYRIETDYVNSWQKQKEFSWQLLNRMPGIQENTPIISNHAIAKFVGSWADTSALNQLYDPAKKGEMNAYWYYTFNKIPLDYIKKNHYTITERIKFLAFNGNLKDSIVVMNPTPTQCLWVLDQNDEANPYIDSGLRAFLPFSKPERILTSSSTQYNSLLWGSLPAENWCTYFEKAKLAQQEQEWQQIIQLYNQSQEKKYSPQNPAEYAPFIEAFAMQKQWDQAVSLTEMARKPIQSPYYPLENYLCSVWKRVQTRNASQPQGTFRIETELNKLSCQP